METMTKFTLKWGIMATGHIAANFVRDLLTDPASRDVCDVQHQVVAVASAKSKEQAVEFCTRVQIPSDATVNTYGSYRELVADKDVSIIYVASPVSHHFQNVMLALEAGKHVLCEKTFTVNAAQAKALVHKAREKRLFLMEAVWTRFLPLSTKVREMVSAGAIGIVHRVIADNSIHRNLPDGKLDFKDSDRVVNPGLAGGAMLELGIYSLTWIMQILYHLQPQEERESPAPVAAAVSKYHTGVDEAAGFLVHFPMHKTMGIGMTTLRLGSGVDFDFKGGPAIKIQGSDGEIQICGPAFRPQSYTVIKVNGGGKTGTIQCPFPQDSKRGGWGHGLFWEADECARCLRDGKSESCIMPLDETIITMEIIEAVLKQGAMEYSDIITSDVYDPESPLNNGY
ncbi:nadp:d-xylose dehydrogenase [Colletotrichum chrysophilum]|uniref:D-xylose 1-dehydrogenase (NADP(+), D-xylono-1,5-lactone-forming) n=1 Tax=Colletotrichum chrysophilum TaxID=1836956 RepID=A0AAD8ZYW2_9PEZI|nr:nadp:d-xylose dehydrogenase [Colletotrichum chrysophilum]